MFYSLTEWVHEPVSAAFCTLPVNFISGKDSELVHVSGPLRIRQSEVSTRHSLRLLKGFWLIPRYTRSTCGSAEVVNRGIKLALRVTVTALCGNSASYVECATRRFKFWLS